MAKLFDDLHMDYRFEGGEKLEKLAQRLKKGEVTAEEKPELLNMVNKMWEEASDDNADTEIMKFHTLLERYNPPVKEKPKPEVSQGGLDGLVSPDLKKAIIRETAETRERSSSTQRAREIAEIPKSSKNDYTDLGDVREGYIIRIPSYGCDSPIRGGGDYSIRLPRGGRIFIKGENPPPGSFIRVTRETRQGKFYNACTISVEEAEEELGIALERPRERVQDIYTPRTPQPASSKPSSRPSKSARERPEKQKKGTIDEISSSIDDLNDFPMGISGEWDNAINFAKMFFYAAKKRTWGTWQDANDALIKARGFFAGFRQDNKKGDILEKYMDGNVFSQLQMLAGVYDRDKAPPKKEKRPPTASEVKMPPKARQTSSALVSFEYKDDERYYVLACGSDDGLNPLVVKADRRLFTGDADLLARYVEEKSESDFPADQRASYRSIMSVIREKRSPAPGNKSRRYLTTFNNEGAKQKNTSFAGHWKPLDKEYWSESDGKKIMTSLLVEGTSELKINVLKVQLTQEVYGGLEMNVINYEPKNTSTPASGR